MNTKNLAIDALRLPLIILVVFIHMNPTFDSVGYWGLTINTIAQVAVPCFFVIAGYFFVGNKLLTLEMYKVKLKKRVVTLLIPYLLWNLVPSLVLIGGNLFSIVFRGKSIEDLMIFLTDLWNDGLWHLWWDKVNGMPSDSPLWFLRDLIVMCVLAPVFYYFIKKGGKLAVVIWFLLYVFLPVSWAHLPGISITAVFFFNIGLYLRYNGIDLVGGSNRIYQLVCVATAFVFLILAVLFRNQWYLYSLFIPVGTFCSFVLIGWAKPSVVKCLAKFSPTIFFVYAIHQTFVLAYVGKMVGLLLPDSYVGDVLVYLTVPFITTAVCIVIYYLLKSVSPRFLRVLCGGR